jgi:hypothetical protein
MPQRLVPPSRRLGAGGLPSHALWRPAPAHIFGADAGTLFLRGPRRWLPMPDVVGCPGDETRARAESQGLPVLPAVRNGAAGGVCCLPGPSPVSRVGRHVALQLRHCLQRVRPPLPTGRFKPGSKSGPAVTKSGSTEVPRNTPAPTKAKSRACLAASQDRQASVTLASTAKPSP